MIARRARRLTLTLMWMVAAASSCAHDNPTPAAVVATAAREREFEFGSRRVQVIVPEGWEALDQGKQKRFRKGEFEIVLQDLGARTPPPRDLDELFDWGLAEVGHNERRDVKSRRTVTLEGREAVDIETWNRLDHTNPQRIFLVTDDGDLLALHTVGMAFADSLAAFDAIRGSFHFVGTRR